MAEIRSFEHPTLKVPYELLNKKFRAAQKTLDREVSHVQTAASELEKIICENRDDIPTRDAIKLLGGMAEKIQVLKRKAVESISEELESGEVCKRRLEHLKEHGSANPNKPASQGAVNQWKRKRLDRMLVEYLLRNGYYNSAVQLAKKSGLEEVTNMDVFMVSREVERSLANKETAKCLAWCHDNRSKLRKLKSNMEFKLRIQEFVELVRCDRRMEAIRHARKYLSLFEEEQLQSIQHCMALLAFPADTRISPYKELLDEGAWHALTEQFRRENCRLFQLARQPALSVALQAGMSALKTPQCYAVTGGSTAASACPVCQRELNELARPLPYAHCAQSRLFCRISGLPLNEHNQPMVLPNGHVYGDKALQKMALDNNGQIVCPTTNDVFHYKKAEKVFVM